MRVLIIPFLSDTQLRRCSSYHWTKVLVRELAARGHYVYWPVPRGQRPPEQFLGPNVEIIPIEPMQSSPYYEMTYLDPVLIEKFHALNGEYVVDVIINEKPMLAPWIRRRLGNFLPKSSPVFVNVHTFLIAGSRMSFLDEDFWRLQAVGSVGWNVWSNKAHEQRAMGAIRPYLSFSELRRVQTLGYFLSAFDPHRMDKHLVGKEKPREPITICYAQAMSETFKYADVIEEMDLLYKAGRPVKLLISTSSESVPVEFRGKDYIETYGVLPQEEFFVKLFSAHAFVALIKDMEMSSSMLEQMYAGQVGILPDVPWARSMTYDGYPYLFGNTAEMRAMLRDVVDNYWSPEVQAVVKKQREFIRDRFDGARLCREFTIKLEELHAEKLKEDIPPAARSIVPVLKTARSEQMTWYELQQFLRMQTRMGLDLDRLRTKADTLTRWSIHWLMQSLGWKDTCKESMPVYVKSEEVE